MINKDSSWSLLLYGRNIYWWCDVLLVVMLDDNQIFKKICKSTVEISQCIQKYDEKYKSKYYNKNKIVNEYMMGIETVIFDIKTKFWYRILKKRK